MLNSLLCHPRQRSEHGGNVTERETESEVLWKREEERIIINLLLGLLDFYFKLVKLPLRLILEF